jgi:hypothetical protein
VQDDLRTTRAHLLHRLLDRFITPAGQSMGEEDAEPGGRDANYRSRQIFDEDER